MATPSLSAVLGPLPVMGEIKSPNAASFKVRCSSLRVAPSVLSVFSQTKLTSSIVLSCDVEVEAATNPI